MNRHISETDVELFKAELYRNERSNATLIKYLHDVRCFQSFAKERTIDKDFVLEYKQFLSENYEKSSANSMIAALNSFFRFMKWEDCIVKQFKIHNKVFCEEEKELKEVELRKLINTAEREKNERLSMVIQTICGTGIRVSELSFFTVQGVKNGTVIITCKGKTRKVMIVKKLKERLLAYAKKHRITSGQIFITKFGKPLDRSNIWREMKELCKSAGVLENKVFPHNLRHLFARHLIKLKKI